MTSIQRRRHGLGAWITTAAMLAIVPAAVASPAGTPAHPAAGKPAPPATVQTGKPQAPSVPTDACSPAPTTQPFTAFGDFHHYTLVPGQAPDDFTGRGWTLTGGANIVTSALQDGTQGSVLDLPGGSKAVSPVMCVTNLDPIARTMVQSLKGSAGVDIKVTYLTRRGHTVSTGNIKGRKHAWALSRVVHIHPSRTSGWQLAQFTFVSHAKKKSDYRIYNFYVDPRMVH